MSAEFIETIKALLGGGVMGTPEDRRILAEAIKEVEKMEVENESKS